MSEEVAVAGDEPLYCVSCGRPLEGMIDDQPDWPTGPLCGDCYQANQMDDEIFIETLGEG